MIIQEFEDLVKNTLNAPFDKRMILTKTMHNVIMQIYEKKDYGTCIRLVLLAKSLKCPIKNLDLIRAKLFIHMDELGGAKECCREELRFFPDNEEARYILKQAEQILLERALEQISPDFEEFYRQIVTYTMVGPKRLQSLYTNAQKICDAGIAGNFVETGVAGGGTSALLAHVIKQNMAHNSERKLFCCDSFEGMPNPTEYDMNVHGILANDTGWGAGTCAAPESSLQEICKKLDVDDVIHIVKGYFEDTIVEHKLAMGNIALLHMDGDWYSSTKTVIENLYDQLVSGAYVQIDDYYSWQGCKKAIDEFFVSRNLSIKLGTIDAEGAYFYKP